MFRKSIIALALLVLASGLSAQTISGGAPNVTRATGTLPYNHGGTGQTSAFTQDGVVYAGSTSALTTSSGIRYNSTGLSIGGVAPVSKLHVYASDSGAGLDGNTNARFESNSDNYIGIFGGTSSDVGIFFGDTAQYQGRIVYHNAGDTMGFWTGNAGSDRMTLSSTYLSLNGNLLAGTDLTYDIGASGASRFRDLFLSRDIALAGSVAAQGSLAAGAAGYMYWTGRSSMRSPSNGVILISNNAETDFTRLQFGGTTSSFPSIKRSSAALAFRLADDSADAAITAGALTSSSTVIFSGLGTDAATTDSSLCLITSTKAVVTGTGTLGICLGTSSIRYKERVKPMVDGLSAIMALQPVNFFYRKDWGDSGKKEQYGLIAEDVAKVLPKLTALDAKGQPNSVDLLGMVPVLIKAVQDLQGQVTALKAELAAVTVH